MAKTMLQVRVRCSEGGDHPYKLVAEGSWQLGDEPKLNAFVPREVFDVLDNLSLPPASEAVTHNVTVGSRNYQIAVEVIAKRATPHDGSSLRTFCRTDNEER